MIILIIIKSTLTAVFRIRTINIPEAHNKTEQIITENRDIILGFEEFIDSHLL